jgi:hypothetical protein
VKILNLIQVFHSNHSITYEEAQGRDTSCKNMIFDKHIHCEKFETTNYAKNEFLICNFWYAIT